MGVHSQLLIVLEYKTGNKLMLRQGLLNNLEKLWLNK